MTRDALKPGQAPATRAQGHGAAQSRRVRRARPRARGRPSTRRRVAIAFVEEAISCSTAPRGAWCWAAGSRCASSAVARHPVAAAFARTCMIEIVGLRALNSTAPLLDEWRSSPHAGGSSTGACQASPTSPPASCRAPIRGSTPGGGCAGRSRTAATIRTFENAFSARAGTRRPTRRHAAGRGSRAGAGAASASAWRTAAARAGPCPAGGTHDHGASGDYGFPHNAPWNPDSATGAGATSAWA